MSIAGCTSSPSPVVKPSTGESRRSGAVKRVIRPLGSVFSLVGLKLSLIRFLATGDGVHGRALALAGQGEGYLSGVSENGTISLHWLGLRYL